MTILEANSKLIPCRICGSSGKISGKRFFGVVCIDDCKGYYLSHGTHGTPFIYDTIDEAVEAWNTKHKQIDKIEEVVEKKEMAIESNVQKMRETSVSNLECESMIYERKCAKYKKALKDIIHLEHEMNDGIDKAGYATGGEVGHYFYKAIKVAMEALK